MPLQGAGLSRPAPAPRVAASPRPTRAPTPSHSSPLPRAAPASGGSDKAIITAAAQKYGINPAVLWGLYGTETAFGKNVTTSSAGAVGPFQFEPGTAASMGVNPYDFKSAAYGAARYLAQYRARGVGGMLSAYNAGPAGGYQAGYVQSTLNNAKTYGSAGGSSIPSAGASPEAVQAVVAHAMGLPAGVRSQSGGSVVPNPKAGGLRLLAAEYRSSDPMLADLLETRAGEGTVQGLPSGVVSTAAGTPSTGTEAQSLVQAPPNLSKPARAPVKINLAEAKRKYGGVPQPGKAVQEAKRSLENETGHPVSVQGVSEELKTHPGRLQEAMNRNYGHGPAQPHMKLPESPPVVAHHPSGTVVKHPSGVPIYLPNERRGRR